MGYTQVALENKLLDMYPEITRNGYAPRMSFDQEKNSWTVKLVKGKEEFTAYLNKKDADACMDGTICETFAAEIGNFLKKAKTH